jgi:hypothetical protein
MKLIPGATKIVTFLTVKMNCRIDLNQTPVSYVEHT